MTEFLDRCFAKSCEDMSELPDGSVHCVVTSPPYWGLRDYEVDGQIGLEDSPVAYLERMVTVGREIKRVLRDDGTFWLNLGDAYFGDSPVRKAQWDPKRDATWDPTLTRSRGGTRRSAAKSEGYKPKDLMLLPHRVAMALQADGWLLRDCIIWHKPNPMPSPVEDRCTPSYEFIFMFAKSSKYFADLSAVREPALKVGTAKHLQGGRGVRAGTRNGLRPREESPNAKGLREAPRVGEEGGNAFSKMPDGSPGANLRNVWTIATEGYPDAHFATYPFAVPARCILIGSPQGGLVLDPFMGSGTTAQAAESLGRHWVGYEINPEYHELIAKRLAQRPLFGAATTTEPDALQSDLFAENAS